jgi:aryl-alcohol dehydrogenase-like predicted oxidoreductase
MALPTRVLGRTGLSVTVLGFGAMELGGDAGGRARPLADEQAGAVLNAVLDAGINYIDTAPDYGESEARIGAHLSSRRDEFFLASKCGCRVDITLPPEGERWPHSFDTATVTAGVEQSLRRMRTDYLDLVQLHQSPSRTVMEAEDTVAALVRLREEGKTRFIGISSLHPNLADHVEMGVFDVFQIPYSALERSHESAISTAAAAGAGVVVRGGVANGLPSERRRNAPKWDVLAAVDLDALVGEMSAFEFLLRFAISHPDMTTTIVGTLNPDHLADNVAAATAGALPPDLYERAKAALSAAGAVPT